ncbi:Ribosome assembly protein rrb1 [Elasticomyces elasticus]|nr:Ribosome assembly protein rrb1 [Elasticomyces elasticus]
MSAKKRAAEQDNITLKAGRRPFADEGEYEDETEDEFEDESGDEFFEAGVDGRPDEEREAEEREMNEDAMEGIEQQQTTFIPGRTKLSPGETLAPDLSTYDIIHEFTGTWPALSLDVLPSPHLSLAPASSISYPVTLYTVSGTQASRGREKENHLLIAKISGLTKMKRDEEGSESESDSDDEEDGDSEPVLETRQIPLTSTTNRIRSFTTPQPSSSTPSTVFVAASLENGDVAIFDISPHMRSLETAGTTISPQQNKPVHIVKAHKRTEGYAIAWSPNNASGRLLTGDTEGKILATTRKEDGSWTTDNTPFTAQTVAGKDPGINDIFWQPNDSNVFASCGNDGCVRIWDIRSKSHKPALTVQVSDTDVNVLSWSKLTPHLLASGHDDGTWATWDLRSWKSSPQPTGASNGLTAKGEVARFNFHKEQITGLQWHPTDDSIVSVCAGDGVISIWDLSVELDDEESKYTADAPDVPPQLLFAHYMNEVKESHWHPQLPGLIVATGGGGYNIFKTFNV